MYTVCVTGSPCCTVEKNTYINRKKGRKEGRKEGREGGREEGRKRNASLTQHRGM